MLFNNPRSCQTAKPKPSVKKGSHDFGTVMLEAVPTGDEDFNYFLVTGKPRSNK